MFHITITREDYNSNPVNLTPTEATWEDLTHAVELLELEIARREIEALEIELRENWVDGHNPQPALV